jgi:hypothetical protein
MMKKIEFLVLMLFVAVSSYAQQQETIISEDLFKNPPAENRPRTWMHAMSGNMSKVGLTKDLEAIADVGIGGIILFNVTHYVPKGKVIFNSADHIEKTKHAAAECERLGLSFGVHNCDGWTSSGGPRVKPEHAMKHMTEQPHIWFH